MGYPTKPHLERRHHCREHFTLNQWTQLAGKNLTKSASEATPPRPAFPVLAQAEQAQQDESPIESIPPAPTAPSMPQATSTDPPATLPVPPAAPPTSEDFITVSGTKFHAMHLELSPPQTDIPGPSEPIALAKETTPA
ncbi:lysine-rich arabinogalactan protein 18-like [Vitis riparia]|uniref:lysine-rich arabinogalactan protein 18-like n=1 Tax=Vitis riparia TaxID=96939 RepID=UPI00155A53B0|nr:lysine-rich arabinogalactan protein 18-like [Vitis riparia]